MSDGLDLFHVTVAPKPRPFVVFVSIIDDSIFGINKEAATPIRFPRRLRHRPPLQLGQPHLQFGHAALGGFGAGYGGG